MKETFRILAVNPGSTSTKISVFENEREVWNCKLSHSAEDIAPYDKIVDQYEFRRKVIVTELEKAGYLVSSFDAVVGRGGVLYPVEGGTYAVNEIMLRHVHEGVQGEHPSNLGALIADSFSRECGCPAFIADPVVVDEMHALARYIVDYWFKPLGVTSIMMCSWSKSPQQRILSLGRRANESTNRCFDSSRVRNCRQKPESGEKAALFAPCQNLVISYQQ